MIYDKFRVLLLGPEDVHRNTCGGIIPKGSTRTLSEADIALYIDSAKGEAIILKCRGMPLRDCKLALNEPLRRSPPDEDWDRSMFGPKPGTWSIESQSDPRWNKYGRSMMLVTAGYPPDAQAWIDECKRLYGKPPDDLAYSCMKD